MDYYDGTGIVRRAPVGKMIASRIAFPVLALLSREQSYKLRLTPIDDERVIMSLKHAKGKVLDIGWFQYLRAQPRRGYRGRCCALEGLRCGGGRYRHVAVRK